VVIIVANGLACRAIYLSDAAVDLARCINRTAVRMTSDSMQAVCPVHDGRTVTALLSPSSPVLLSRDSDVALVRGLGLPEDAIFYNGPDTPSRGRVMAWVDGPKPWVYAYDGGYRDNRKYSSTTALSPEVVIERPLAETSARFIIVLRREPTGKIGVVDLQ
jgi:hypothetical protein